MSIDRTIRPQIHLPENLVLEEANYLKLSNGIPLHHINAPRIDVLKIELVFKVGIWQQKKPLQALFASRLLKEGTKAYSSQEIAELLDYYGAYLQCQHSHHFTTVLLYVLKKHLKHLIPLLESIIKDPVFDAQELAISVNNKRQEFLVESQKVQTLSLREFNKAFYGEKHPYANRIELDDFDKIHVQDLKDFHQRYFNGANCHLFVTGHLDEGVFALLDAAFGVNWNLGTKSEELPLSVDASEQRFHFVAKEDAIQCGLRLGREGLLKSDKNFHDATILASILGGYFGSRLMKNIREEKGYTYGIGASVAANKYHGYWSIQSEMATENALPVLKEIFAEFKDLRENLIPDEELEMVKNYLLGELARSFDGPFARAESHLMLWLYDLDNSHISDYEKRISCIDSEQIRKLACCYLDEKDWKIVAAGHPDLKNDFQKFVSSNK